MTESLSTAAYAATSVNSRLAPFRIQRRVPAPREVLLDILYCGICHTDIHMTRGELPGTVFPMVPGHEIVGRVALVGGSVIKHRVGDIVGVGCMVASCRECAECRAGEEQFCAGLIGTYSALEPGASLPTYGGYSARITVHEDYVLSIPPDLAPAAAAPLLCAGITTYSPLKHWNVGHGSAVGVVGLGGLGHITVKMAAAMGAEVSVLSTSERKRNDALKYGASHFIDTTAPGAFERAAGRFDLILSTVSARIDYDAYISLLKRDGTLVLLGIPDEPVVATNIFGLLMKRRKVSASLIGGIRETQEMLDFCGAHRIGSDIELIRIQDVNEAYERILKGDVRYRFVIDMSSLPVEHRSTASE